MKIKTLDYNQRRIKSLENKVKDQIKLIFELGEELNECSNTIYELRRKIKDMNV